MLFLLGMLAIILGLYGVLQGRRAANYIKKFDYPPAGALAAERVIVFCPCKGTDPNFDQNVRSILEQDHPNFRVQFVVDSPEDEAFLALRKLGVTDVLVAGPAADRGQKVHNLAYAVENAGAGDIYVFCDSDVRFPKDWLSSLVSPLSDPQAGVTTGYRWYVADRWSLPILLRSAWNAVSAAALSEKDWNFAWGGSLGIRRDTFRSLEILKAWQGAVSDDFAITMAVRSAGLKIVFVPRCLVPSYGGCTWAELLEFTTRQMIITRVYNSSLWRIAFANYVFFNATFAGLALAALSDVRAALLWLAVYLLSAVRSWIRLEAVSSVLSSADLYRFKWFYILFSPLVAILYLYNLIHSALTTNIVWRDVGYRLVSPHETRVIRRPSPMV